MRKKTRKVKIGPGILQQIEDNPTYKYGPFSREDLIKFLKDSWDKSFEGWAGYPPRTELK